MDGHTLRQIMGCFATGVAVVTTSSPEGPYGLTVNSLASLSLDPPLILFCIDQTAGGYELFQPGEYFCINILALDQVEVSKLFAKKGAGDRFLFVPWEEGEHGVPILRGNTAYLVCRVETRYPGGDHSIVVGRVLNGEKDDARDPLIFYKGQYKRLEAAAIC